MDLGKLALRGLLNRNPELDPKYIDYLMFGTVIQVLYSTAVQQYLQNRLALIRSTCSLCNSCAPTDVTFECARLGQIAAAQRGVASFED